MLWRASQCWPLRESITEAREALAREGDLFSPASPQKLYKSSWENQKAKGFELRLDSLGFLAAKANRDLASEVSRCSMKAAIFRPGESERVCTGSSAESQGPICEVGGEVTALHMMPSALPATRWFLVAGSISGSSSKTSDLNGLLDRLTDAQRPSRTI